MIYYRHKNDILSICLRNVLFICLISISPSAGYSQSYHTQRFLPDVKIDSLEIIYGKIHIFSDNQLFSFSGSSHLDKELIRPSVEQPVFYFEDLVIYSFINYEDGYLLSTDSGLKVFIDGQLKDYSIPTEDDSFIGSQLCKCGNQIGILLDGKFSIWDPIEYIVKSINLPPSVNLLSPECDDWRAFWLSNGTDLYSVSSDRSSTLPEVQVENVRIDNNVITFSTSVYHPKFKDLSLSYRWDKDPDQWYDIESNELLRIEMPEDNINRMQLRATVDQLYYGYGSWIELNIHENTLNPLWYFLLIPLSIIIAAIYMTSREKRNNHKISMLKEKYELRSKAEKLEGAAQQLRMNPHFLFNALTSIQGLIAAKRNDDARKQISRYANISRFLLAQTQNDRISIEEEVKFLEDYLSLEKMVFNGELSFQINNHCEPDVLIPPMLIQPLVENSIKHGFRGRKSGLVTIHMGSQERILSIEVIDDGIGRKASGTNKENDKNNSFAIESIKSRLKHIHRFRDGSLIINDLYDSDGTPGGTQCILTIPI